MYYEYISVLDRVDKLIFDENTFFLNTIFDIFISIRHFITEMSINKCQNRWELAFRIHICFKDNFEFMYRAKVGVIYIYESLKATEV